MTGHTILSVIAWVVALGVCAAVLWKMWKVLGR